MTTTPPPAASPQLLADAVQIATEAGQRTLNWFLSPNLPIDIKDDGSPVTAADRDAEAFIRAELAGRYPDDAVAGEEEADIDGTSGQAWMIDPIDGTKAFTRGVPLFSTLISVTDQYGPAVGVIVLPALNEVVSAGRGLGAFHNGTPCGVNTTAEMAKSYACTSAIDLWSAAQLASVQATGAAVRTWGDAYGYALVATGRAEAMIDPIASVWDLAPMLVILPEAGGRFTDLSGNPSAVGGSGLGTNGLLHDVYLQALAP